MKRVLFGFMLVFLVLSVAAQSSTFIDQRNVDKSFWFDRPSVGASNGLFSAVGGSRAPPNSENFVLVDSNRFGFSYISEVNADDEQGNEFVHYVTVDGKVVGSFNNDGVCSSKLLSRQGGELQSVYCFAQKEPVSNGPFPGWCGVSNGRGAYWVVACRESYIRYVMLPELSPGSHSIGVYRLSDYGYSGASVYLNHVVSTGKACPQAEGQDCQANCPQKYTGALCSGQGSSGNFIGRTTIYRENSCSQVCPAGDPKLQSFVGVDLFSVVVPVPPVVCGDNLVGAGETCVTCPADVVAVNGANACPVSGGQVCNNNSVCEGFETHGSCPLDCAVGEGGVIVPPPWVSPPVQGFFDSVAAIINSFVLWLRGLVGWN